MNFESNAVTQELCHRRRHESRAQNCRTDGSGNAETQCRRQEGHTDTLASSGRTQGRKNPHASGHRNKGSSNPSPKKRRGRTHSASASPRTARARAPRAGDARNHHPRVSSQNVKSLPPRAEALSLPPKTGSPQFAKGGSHPLEMLATTDGTETCRKITSNLPTKPIHLTVDSLDSAPLHCTNLQVKKCSSVRFPQREVPP